MKSVMRLVCFCLVLCLCGCDLLPASPGGTAAPPVSTTAGPNQTTFPVEGSTPPLETDPPETTPSPIQQPEPGDEDFVRVRDYLPGIAVELAYATEKNFTGQIIYEFTEPWLRYGTVKKLLLVQEELAKQGLGLKIWDAFRPTAAQFKLWDVYPDSTYVSDPNKGFSSHSRGNTVDITLVRADGTELTMPTGFDDFSKLADRDYSDCSQDAAQNALLLEQTMEKHGFKPYSGEWWHFTDRTSYPVEKEFQPVPQARYYADCKEYINLRLGPSSDAQALTQILVKEEFLVLAWRGDFAYVEYMGLQGYVLGSYICPVQDS